MATFDELFKDKKLWMPDMFREGIERGGEKAFTLFVRADGTVEETTYNDIKAESEALSEKLKAAGLRPGDRLAVVSALRPVWYSLIYTALRDGYRMVCIDPGIAQPQIQSMMRQTEVRAVFTSNTSLELPQIFEGRIPMYSVEPGFPLLNGCERADALLGTASDMPEDTFFVLFSSGTTGETRKGVLLPHTSVTVAIEYGTSTDAGIYKDKPSYSLNKRDLMLFPPYHIAGLLCAVYDIYCNTQVIIPEKLAPTILSTVLQELKPDNICTVPSMLTMLMNKINAGLAEKKLARIFANTLLKLSGFMRKSLGINAGRRLTHFLNKKAFGGEMKGFMIGGSSCDADTMRFYLNMGMDVSLAYGLTELGAPLAVTGKGYYPGTTGRVLRHTDAMDIRVVQPDEKGRGQVEVLSPYRMITYLNPDDNEGCFTEDGYFRTGDIGYFDEENCLVICGRAKETIVFRNGEKMMPEEIEAFYKDVKSIGDLAVFKVPDGECDAFSIAVTKPADMKGLPDDVFRMHVQDKAATLSGNLVPREVYVLPSLPLSSTRKVQRFKLTEMAVGGLSAPQSENTFTKLDEDGATAELRSLLVKVGGSQWKSAELTEGLLLGLDSLQTMELLVEVQDHFGLDLFTLAKPPETFGELLDAVNNFDTAEKSAAGTLDLSIYPEPVGNAERRFYNTIKKGLVKAYHVHGEGMEKIPEEESVILCSNHVTALDPGWIMGLIPDDICRRTGIVGKRDVLDSKTLKNFVRSQNIIPVDRTANAMATLDRCRELLEEGWNILIFPEGTNYESTTTVHSFRDGAARLALATGKPLLPIHIKGAATVDSNKAGLIPPVSRRIDISFGELIYPGERTTAEINEELKAAIEAL